MQLNGKGHGAPMRVEPNPNIPIEALQDEHVLSVKDLLGVLWRRLWVIVLVALVLAGSAVGFDLSQTPTYKASIKILVGQEQQSGVPGSLGGEV